MQEIDELRAEAAELLSTIRAIESFGCSATAWRDKLLWTRELIETALQEWASQDWREVAP